MKLESYKTPVLALLVCMMLALTGGAVAGEIAGLRPTLPLFLERDLEITFVNDFLGRGGASDDFRTQQSIFSATFSDRWVASIDHSILTLDDPSASGRIDQFSVSLGYEWVQLESDTRIDRLLVGTGLRNVGEFAGERIQNGFHQLVGSTIEEWEYTNTTANDLTAWFDAERYGLIRDTTDKGLFSTWRMGYQLRVSSLVTTGGEWDSAVSLQAIISKPTLDFWLGIRSDWRDGYDDPVLRATANAEEDLALVLGARFGPLVAETVQQFNNEASYGQIRLVSSFDNTRRHESPDFGLDLSVLLPDVQLRLGSRVPVRFLTDGSSQWNEAIVIGVGYGEPQYGNNNSLFTRSRQIDAGIEFERPLLGNSSWVTTYGSIGAGWREEQLFGAGDLRGESSTTAGRTVFTASAGLRFEIFNRPDQWQIRAQFGLLGRLPLDDAMAEVAGETYPIQQSALDLMIGIALDFG